MIQVVGAMSEIGARIDAGEGAEVVIEVRLVEVAAPERDVGPIDVVPAMNAVQHLLEAANPAEELGSESDLFTEDLNKPAPAEADVAG